MSDNNLTIPTRVAQPRCFVLEPVLNEAQAYTQAGEHKSKVFGNDFRRMLNALGKKPEARIDIKLLQRRLVPFWYVHCGSHFDYTRIRDYTINAYDPDAILITILGSDRADNPTEVMYRVDTTGRSRLVHLTGIERCMTKRDEFEWIDSYTHTSEWPAKQLEPHQKMLQDSALQHPRPVIDIEIFAQNLLIDGNPLFTDNIETIVVNPLETAENVVRRILQNVMVPIQAATIYDWGLNVEAVDLYFRPIFVFEFVRLDKDNNPVDRKLEELDALKKDRWVNLETTEYQMSNIPWAKILKLSADIGAIVLNDIPIVGTTMKVISAVATQGPEIADDMKK